ncbi:MAG: hypothetical protein LBF90_05190 [Prevotellaceae bacterium]|nr:hypothetical protein [Prevotellaceae bacterium]
MAAQTVSGPLMVTLQAVKAFVTATPFTRAVSVPACPESCKGFTTADAVYVDVRLKADVGVTPHEEAEPAESV